MDFRLCWLTKQWNIQLSGIVCTIQPWPQMQYYLFELSFKAVSVRAIVEMQLKPKDSQTNNVKITLLRNSGKLYTTHMNL